MSVNLTCSEHVADCRILQSASHHGCQHGRKSGKQGVEFLQVDPYGYPGIRKTKMMGRHDIVTMQDVKYLNTVTGIYCFCKCRRCKRRYIETSLVDEILASAIQPYGIRHCSRTRTIWHSRTFMYALDSPISHYHHMLLSTRRIWKKCSELSS